jgi:hypothetical protein
MMHSQYNIKFRTVCPWILRKWIAGRNMDEISSPVTYFSTTDIKLQIPLPDDVFYFTELKSSSDVKAANSS